MKVQRKIRFFTQYFITNILLTTVVFFAAVIFFVLPLAQKDKESQINRAIVEISEQQKWLDDRVTEYYKSMYTISEMPLITEISNMKAPYSSLDTDTMRQLIYQLSIYSVSQDTFSNIILYFKHLRLFLDSFSTGTNAENYFNSRFDSEYKSYNNWLSEITANDKKINFSKLKKSGKEIYIILLEFYGYLNNKTLFMAEFNNLPFAEKLKSSRFFNDSLLITCTSANEIIFSSSAIDVGMEIIKKTNSNSNNFQQVVIDGENYTTIKKFSPVMDIHYIWLIRNRVLFSEANQRIRILFMTCILLLIAFSLLSTYFAYNNTRPISKLIKSINSKVGEAYKKGNNEIEYINNSFSKLADKNLLLMDEMNTHFENAKTLFFTKILNGLLISPQEVLLVKSLVEDFFYYRSYSTVLVDFLFESDNYNNISSMYTKNLLLSIIPKNVFLCETGVNRYALIFCHNQSKEQCDVSVEMERITEMLSSDKVCSFICIIGDACDLPEQLYFSYYICNHVIEKINYDRELYINQTIKAKDMKINLIGYYYPIYEEQGLLNCISSRKYEEAKALLEKIFRQNYEDEDVSLKEKKYFVDAVCSTFLRLARLSDIYDKKIEEFVEDIIYKIKNTSDGWINYRYFVSIIDFIKTIQPSNSNNHANYIYNQVIDLIEENYSNPEFSILDITNKLKISKNYISVIFKKNNRSGVAAAIEEKRMEIARDLVENSNTYIKDICEMTGYLNLNTFYKAFKRYFGVTPMHYRNLHPNKLE